VYNVVPSLIETFKIYIYLEIFQQNNKIIKYDFPVLNFELIEALSSHLDEEQPMEDEKRSDIPDEVRSNFSIESNILMIQN
jgi:hypothetical protein